VQRDRGFSLVELLVTLVLLSALITVSAPPLLTTTRRLRVEMAAHELTTLLRHARMLATREGAKVGLRFMPRADGRVAYGLYVDGDGDGVSTRDIEDGTDPPQGPPRELIHLGAHVRLGFPPGPPPRDPGNPGRRLKRLGDPIRLNRSNIASFGPLGTSTPGSLYLTDGVTHLAVVRLYGRTGKVSVMLYDREREAWN
jgi:prepilin-type N-terminal cleavage/methylation domain-containing protein